MLLRHARSASLLPLCILLITARTCRADEPPANVVTEHVEGYQAPAPAPPAMDPPAQPSPAEHHEEHAAQPSSAGVGVQAAHGGEGVMDPPAAVHADAPAAPSLAAVHSEPEPAHSQPVEAAGAGHEPPQAAEAGAHEAPQQAHAESVQDAVSPSHAPIEPPSSPPQPAVEVHPPVAEAPLHIDAPPPAPVADAHPPVPHPEPVVHVEPSLPPHVEPPHENLNPADVHVVQPSVEAQPHEAGDHHPGDAMHEEVQPSTAALQKRKSPRTAQRDEALGYAPAWEGHQQGDAEHDEHGDPVRDSDEDRLPGDEDDKVAFPGFEDDYYGLKMNPADNVDPAAFQPSHIFEFYVERGATDFFYEEVTPAQAGRAIRGDWFVTAGDLWNAEVMIMGPDGTTLYSEGPFTVSEEDGIETTEPTGEGSFRFLAEVPGIYTISFHNPSNDEPRGITFAWLFGRDDDDNVALELAGVGNRTALFPQALPPGMNSSDTSTGFMLHMMARVSRLHKRIDELSSLQSYVDVSFRRHANTAEGTRARVMRWTIIESIVVAAVAILQVVIMRRFDVKPTSSFSGFPTRSEQYRSIV